MSRAAERLGVTQSGLSTAMKRLEYSLGTVLFTRNSRGIQLTKAGRGLQHKGHDLLLSWEQLRQDIGKLEQGVSGQYIIGCHPSVALYCLPTFLPDLIQRHPKLEIKLHHDLSRKITEDVISFKIDIGLVVNPVRHPDLVIKNLCADEVTFWVSQNPSSTQILDQQKGVLICDLNLIQVKKLLGDLRKQGHGFNRVIQSSSLEVVAHLTTAGVGVGILPAKVATKELQVMDKRIPPFRDAICLIYRPDHQKTQGAKTIINEIKKAMIQPSESLPCL